MSAGRMLTPALSIERHAVLRRRRDLPVAGKILVNEGDFVRQSDIVASAELPGDLLIVRIPEQMGLEPFEVIKGLRVTEGAVVTEGQVLCEHTGLLGLFKTRYQSPYDGVVELISRETGHVGVRLASTKLELNAYLSGRVVAVEDSKGLTIAATGSIIQGIFGVGGERQGTLHILPCAPDKPVAASDIPDHPLPSAVFVGGCRPSLEALRKAESCGAKGFVTASIDGDTLRQYLGFDLGVAVTGNEEVPMSLVVTEGFGTLAFSEKSIELFRELDGKAASLNGTTQVRAGAIRPEVIVCEEHEPEDASASESLRVLQVKSHVRIIRLPHFGAVGTVVELPPAPQTLESGSVARVARIRLQDGETVIVPRANLELL